MPLRGEGRSFSEIREAWATAGVLHNRSFPRRIPVIVGQAILRGSPGPPGREETGSLAQRVIFIQAGHGPPVGLGATTRLFPPRRPIGRKTAWMATQPHHKRDFSLPRECSYQLEDVTAFQLKHDSVPRCDIWSPRSHGFSTSGSSPTSPLKSRDGAITPNPRQGDSDRKNHAIRIAVRRSWRRPDP